MDAVLFWILAGLSVVGGLVVITGRNPLASALALGLVLIAIAGLFAMLSAHLLFILQLLVYAGAIIVLIVFVIMLLDLDDRRLGEMKIRWGRFGVSAAICLVACVAVLRGVRGLTGLREPVHASFGTVTDVSRLLFGPYLVQFEILGLILLVGILGAVVLAKRGG
ncbi:MAG: NADH-quinone oxidoreductase subunit J [Candidatus Eisenbacteria bacterium]|nr:NADH-quinone oxidoreductase subunit J [Candidatus Latescibacterota bacterium]MBD3303034.1 NADH-quinone oxidoreductase subunit J [Candidatus Eisenbacteria bacterium]